MESKAMESKAMESKAMESKAMESKRAIVLESGNFEVPSPSGKAKLDNQELGGQASNVFFVALIGEEKEGRPLPGQPIKIRGACPSAMGSIAGELIRRRYTGAVHDSLECQPRSKIASILLKSSYLVIHFKCVSDALEYSADPKAFIRFTRSLRGALKVRCVDASAMLRRRKANVLTASAILCQ
jgi:hypothetical protein